jgi:uncharacterized protein (TIGR03437 family)
MLIRTVLFVLCLETAIAATAPTTPTQPSYPELSYSTYLRDAFTPNAIALDGAGNVYLAGSVAVDPSILQTTALIVKLNPQATQYLYVRYLGGSVYDSATAIAVDSAGNAYVAGVTGSPDFPITTGGNLGTPASGTTNERSFISKLDPNGNVVFSDLLGGSASSQPQAVAVTAVGQVLVSGTSQASGFPTTPGAYSISNSQNHPYLLELNPAGTALVFSATGIGGSALALDSAGNIYIAGSTYLLDYPTTPGAYQTTFPTFIDCVAPCFMGAAQGENQYVTKVNPSASQLIFSTSLSGTDNTTNAGLALDAAGDVWVTGIAGATFPYTVAPPALQGNYVGLGPLPALPYLSELDPTGSKLLVSVPVGGAGVAVDASGNVYVGGMAGSVPGPDYGYSIAGNIPSLANIPGPCLPNATNPKASYVSQVDGNTGNLRGTEFLEGSTLVLSGAALSGSTLWITGGTGHPDFPFSPNALTLPNFQPAPLLGAYLGAVNFGGAQPPAGAPQVGCILNAADYAFAGPVASYEVLSIFGSGLGPVAAVTASNYITGVLGGTDVSFGSTPSPLLYVSSSQINFAVPAELSSSGATNMQVTVNGVSSPARQLPLAYYDPSLYLGSASTSGSGLPPTVLAVNADGAVNSSTNPAPAGSTVSVFLNGIAPNPNVGTSPIPLTSNNGWTVASLSNPNPFVVQVNLQVPAMLQDDYSCNSNFSLCSAEFQLYDVYDAGAGPAGVNVSGIELAGTVYVTETH